MAEHYIINGMIYVEGQFRTGILGIHDGKIALYDANYQIPENAEVFDANNKKIVPGFIDIQRTRLLLHVIDVSGSEGRNPVDDFEKIGNFFAGNGTTSWLASILTDTTEQTDWCIEQYKAYKASARKGAQLLGFHMEGPFLAAEYKGAMPQHLLRKGDISLVERYQKLAEGGIRYITVSPE